MQQTIGEIVITIGFMFLLTGTIGQFKFKTFYKRLLVSSIIDSASVLLIFTGIIIIQGLSSFSYKVVLILIIMFLINPLATHKLGRSAYLSHLSEENDAKY